MANLKVICKYKDGTKLSDSDAKKKYIENSIIAYIELFKKLPQKGEWFGDGQGSTLGINFIAFRREGLNNEVLVELGDKYFVS